MNLHGIQCKQAYSPYGSDGLALLQFLLILRFRNTDHGLLNLRDSLRFDFFCEYESLTN